MQQIKQIKLKVRKDANVGKQLANISPIESNDSYTIVEVASGQHGESWRARCPSNLVELANTFDPEPAKTLFGYLILMQGQGLNYPNVFYSKRIPDSELDAQRYWLQRKAWPLNRLDEDEREKIVAAILKSVEREFSSKHFRHVFLVRVFGGYNAPSDLRDYEDRIRTLPVALKRCFNTHVDFRVFASCLSPRNYEAVAMHMSALLSLYLLALHYKMAGSVLVAAGNRRGSPKLSGYSGVNEFAIENYTDERAAKGCEYIAKRLFALKRG